LYGFELLVFVVWFFPILVVSFILYGYLRSKLCFKTADSIQKIIIQITTIQNYNIVNKNIATIRSYDLPIPHEIWVIAEDSSLSRYIGADKILDVPANFKSIAKYKARALDYSSQVRAKMGITSPDVKILFLDDDSIPSRKYVEKCFTGDYDIMQGIIQPRLNYGTRYSYVENMRTLACMSVCSVYQSSGHPVWVHGEGMCVKASTEQKIGWNFDLIASEDLVFGHACATEKMKWGFIWEPIYNTSPWSFKDFFKQRKRWLWGNAHAISSILTWKSKVRMISFYVVGGSILWISILGSIMDLSGMINFSTVERAILYASFATWLGIYGYIGYTIGNGNPKHILLSMVLVWYTSFMNTFPIWIGLFLRPPKRFEVIAKEKKKKI
jgi:hypothetical protein